MHKIVSHLRTVNASLNIDDTRIGKLACFKFRDLENHRRQSDAQNYLILHGKISVSTVKAACTKEGYRSYFILKSQGI